MSDTPPVHRPIVARTARRAPVTAAVAMVSLLGAAVFLSLAQSRDALADREALLPPLANTAVTTPVPLVLPPSPAPAPVAVVIPAAVAPPVPVAAPVPHYAMPIVAAPVATPEPTRTPTLIVDLAQADTNPTPAPVAAALAGAAAVPPPDPTRNLNANEKFASRVGGQEVEVVQAERLTGLDRLIPQGAIVGAVMETALNSDLPGYARAVVQRDVLSFDGSTTLIPAGSRVIGEYKSGVAQGASRVFIVWTRLIRPDGVSVALASPAIDDLGRGGVAGHVNSHFLKRFGGAILISVLTGGISAGTAALSSGSTVIVGGLGQTSQLANEASNDLNIPPTITTPQGASVRIFVARDLDFSKVGPAA